MISIILGASGASNVLIIGIALDSSANRNYLPPIPCRHEGRFAVVTKRGAGCDGPLPASGVLACQTKRRRRTVKSCGPGAATLASIPAGLCWRGNGGKKGRSPGRARNKPPNHCAGKAGMSWLYLSNPCASSTTPLHTVLRVPPAPDLPCALHSRGSKRNSKAQAKIAP